MSEKVSAPSVTCRQIAARFPQLFTEIIGDADRKVDGVAAPENARATSAVFLSTGRALVTGLKSPALVLVVDRKNRDEVVKNNGDRTILVSPNVELAMAQTTNAFFLATPFKSEGVQGIHSTAVVSTLATIGANVRIGPHAYIGARVQIKDGAYIGASAVIEDDCEIGSNTVIHPQVYVGHSTMIGEHCEIHPMTVIGKEGFGYAHDEKGNHYKIPHQGRVVIEDDVHIGAVCAIDRSTFNETRISRGTKIDNTVHIAHNCSVGRNSLITAGFIMAGSSKVGANFIAGGNTGVTGHVEIGDNVQLAGLSGVTKNITKPGAYGGYPLQPLQSFLKTKAAMTHLPEMRKQIAKIMKHLGLNQESESESES